MRGKKTAIAVTAAAVVAAAVATPLALREVIPTATVDCSPHLFVYQGETCPVQDALSNIKGASVTVWGTLDIDEDGVKEWASHDAETGAGFLMYMVKGVPYILTLKGDLPLSWRQDCGQADGYKSIPIDIVDADFNNDGILCRYDYDILHSRLGAALGDPQYRRQMDINYDDVLNEVDELLFNATAKQYPKLSIVQDAINTGEYERLTWPDGTEAWLATCSPSEADIRSFAGHFLGTPGWISVLRNDYDNGCTCQWYSKDTAIAAYKALGYGRFSIAYSLRHAYIMFWTGGDWQDLNNWMILEPRDGTVKTATISEGYATYKIFFPISSDGDVIYCKVLRVSKANESVYYRAGISKLAIGSMEEPVPATFNTSLGIPVE